MSDERRNVDIMHEVSGLIALQKFVALVYDISGEGKNMNIFRIIY